MPYIWRESFTADTWNGTRYGYHLNTQDSDGFHRVIVSAAKTVGVVIPETFEFRNLAWQNLCHGYFSQVAGEHLTTYEKTLEAYKRFIEQKEPEFEPGDDQEDVTTQST